MIRLGFRQPPIKTVECLHSRDFTMLQDCEEKCLEVAPTELVQNINIQVITAGFDLPRKVRRTNRIRAEDGLCADSLYKWGTLPAHVVLPTSSYPTSSGTARSQVT